MPNVNLPGRIRRIQIIRTPGLPAPAARCGGRRVLLYLSVIAGFRSSGLPAAKGYPREQARPAGALVRHHGLIMSVWGAAKVWGGNSSTQSDRAQLPKGSEACHICGDDEAMVEIKLRPCGHEICLE